MGNDRISHARAHRISPTRGLAEHPTPGGSAPAWAGRLQTVAAAGGIEEERGDVDSGEGEGE